MGAELGFQVADIYGPHAAIIVDVTMLVISISRPWNEGAKKHTSTEQFVSDSGVVDFLLRIKSDANKAVVSSPLSCSVPLTHSDVRRS